MSMITSRARAKLWFCPAPNTICFSFRTQRQTARCLAVAAE